MERSRVISVQGRQIRQPGFPARPLRDPDQAPPVLRDGPSVITRLDHIHQLSRGGSAVDKKRLGAGCVNGARPDLRGGDLNCAWTQYCDTTTGNQVANREHKPYPRHKRRALLTRSCGSRFLKLTIIWPQLRLRRAFVDRETRWLKPQHTLSPI